MSVVAAAWAVFVFVLVRRERRNGLSLYWSTILACLLIGVPALAAHLLLGLFALVSGHITFDAAFDPLTDNITIGALLYCAAYFFRRQTSIVSSTV